MVLVEASDLRYSLISVYKSIRLQINQLLNLLLTRSEIKEWSHSKIVIFKK